jgi:hypothetical protein
MRISREDVHGWRGESFAARVREGRGEAVCLFIRGNKF